MQKEIFKTPPNNRDSLSLVFTDGLLFLGLGVRVAEFVRIGESRTFHGIMDSSFKMFKSCCRGKSLLVK
jgi:hypothetical protein